MNKQLVFLLILVAAFVAAVMHNTRVDRRARDVGGTRFTPLAWKVPLVPSLSSLGSM
mgnify:CR=1